VSLDVKVQRGFILQPTYRLEGGRPVVHLYGRLEEGGPFLIRDGRQIPHFYVQASDAARARAAGAVRQVPSDRVTLTTGQPVVRVEVDMPADTRPVRDALIAAGIAPWEADVRFAMRYLIDREIRGALEIRGQGRATPGVGVVFDQPELAPADWSPVVTVLSIDIETDPRARRLLSVGLHGCGVSETLLLTPPGWSCPEGAQPFPSEKELLAGLARRVRELDPDVITGWNVVDFDLAVLCRIAERLQVPLPLGRDRGGPWWRDTGSARNARQVSLPGRLVLDGIGLLRGAFVRVDDYGLDAVARELLGEGKTLTGPERAEEILQLFKHDRARLVEYNRTDARLALAIIEKLRLVELAVERSKLTGMPLDRVSSSIAAFDFLYLSRLGRRGVVAPSVRAAEVVEPQAGGHVLASQAGLHRQVVVLDFKSLYPSLIRTFEIDPLNLVRPEAGAVAGDDDIVAPNGAAFRRARGLLPALLDEIMPRREEARRAGDAVKSHAIKILMNSFYGVLGTPACRFYDPRLANAITGFGREILLWCRARIEEEGRQVLYGDTDSLFVASGAPDAATATSFGAGLAARLNRALAAYIQERWRVESRLDLVFDRLYLRLCLPAMRGGGMGARKRYAGLVDDHGTPRVVFTGMEVVRSDWTALAREVQRELYTRLFTDQPVDEYLRDVVARLRAGQLDDRLVYHKALRKMPEAYTATTPPHVAAARQLGRQRGRIAYVITRAGPQPADAPHAPLDHQHYIDKQVRAVAEQVLALLGRDFGEIAGDGKQLRLF
jgi:DNA polymerase-2